MNVPLPFPHSISSHEVLVELARAIRFCLRATPQMTPGTEAQEFDWREIDFPAELLMGADEGDGGPLEQKESSKPAGASG